jgi:hypothetical protein
MRGKAGAETLDGTHPAVSQKWEPPGKDQQEWQGDPVPVKYKHYVYLLPHEVHREMRSGAAASSRSSLISPCADCLSISKYGKLLKLQTVQRSARW